MQKFIIRVDDANNDVLANMSDECYVLNSKLEDSYCQKFMVKASQTDKLVLFYGENAQEVAKKFGADGVVLDFGADNLKAKMVEARKLLGKNKIIGLFTRNRRHESMLVSEVEPDFVVFKVWKDGFEQVKELTDWYNDFFLIQSAAWLVDEDINIAELNTDFIIKP